VSGVPNLINMPGCPANGVNLVATIVHYLTFNSLPSLDDKRRPRFAYDKKIHEEGHCERYPFYEAGLYVRNWGDAGHRQGYCLKEVGCKGPGARHNCFRRNWNSNTSWPIGAGAICIGCTHSRFWDKKTPFFKD
jgi:hydrogenase small subunit